MENQSAPSGWYPDPNKGPFERFWNGSSWTDQINRRYEYNVWSETDSWTRQSRKMSQTVKTVQKEINLRVSEGWELFDTLSTDSIKGSDSGSVMLIFRRTVFQ